MNARMNRRGRGIKKHISSRTLHAKNMDGTAHVVRIDNLQVVITRHGKPAAVVIGFRDEDDWFDYRVEHDERFLRKVAKAREEIRKGKYVTLDELSD